MLYTYLLKRRLALEGIGTEIPNVNILYFLTIPNVWYFFKYMIAQILKIISCMI